MISLRKVSVHNLKSVDLDLPLGKLIVFCGRSGSGKSSLALDTLYAEGQRRYIETFSPAMRHFLEKIEKPKAELLDGIPPAIAVTAVPSKSNDHTVGDLAEIADSLALLFANIGHVFCPTCSRPITIDSPQTILNTLNTFFETKIKIQIAFSPPLENNADEFAALWKEQGFLRGIFNGKTFSLDEKIPAELYHEGLLLIVDRLTLDSAEEDRLIESLETALEFGDGKCTLLLEQKDGTQTTLLFSRYLSCEYCNVHVPPLSSRIFYTDWKQHVHLFDAQTSPTMDDLLAKTVAELIPFFDTLNMSKNVPLENIRHHLRYLQQVGLEYLTLDRPVSTLSGGEQRRVALAGVLGSSLVDMLYILDEPSQGLHPSETEKLLEAILQLRDRGNTVVLVEHDPLLLCRADYLVEIGPGAGDDGGTITFQGNFSELLNDTKNITGRYLAADPPPSPLSHSQAKGTGSITLTGCTGNNLQNLSVSFPLGLLCVVTGVSGAGKSTLIRQTLYPALCQHFCTKSEITGLPFEKMTVSGTINEVVLIDQTPMGRSSSSNPVTYLKVFDEIRNVFAATLDAQAKNITARHFSFNVEGGRCEHCKGDGNIVIDMQFLPDQIVRCPECQGKRYRAAVLDILYRGKSIAEVLEMTAREAFSFFRGQNKLQQKLKRLFDVGLDYLRIGQSANTLSGGETQRLKLAAYLLQIRGSRSLILMDEPTAGLHFADVEQLLDCFQALIAAGHSLIVIEHNEMVIRSADHRIELTNGGLAGLGLKQ